jgi:Raf kinase inhibitor-like YbhB/YbcL family protein
VRCESWYAIRRGRRADRAERALLDRALLLGMHWRSIIRTDAERRSRMALRLTWTAFQNGGGIPARHTCDDEDLSPPLSWSGAPANTQSFVLIADDPDAPDPRAPRMVWVHWVIYDLPAAVGSLGEGVRQLPPGARLGVNDFHRAAYGGPCPPIGKHRYFFKLYALDTELGDLGKKATKADVEQAMKAHVLAEATLVGTYERSR